MNNGLGVRWDDLPQLRERAVSLLLSGPARAPALAERIFGWRQGPPRLAASLVREVLGADPRFQLSRGRWLLSDEQAGYGSTSLHDLDFVVVDVESTGGSPARGDRVTEVAAVRVCGGQVVDSFESLINPERPIPPSVTALTNITDEMVAGAPRFADLAEPLQRALEGAVFVAHNAGFDWRFLQAEYARCRRGRLGGERVCTLRLARRLHPELSRRSLDVLADYYAIAVDSWHRAGSDARTTAELFIRFLGQLADRGVGDWERLQAYLRGEHPPGAAKARARKGKGGSKSRRELPH
ncbi:MAG: 3'-5' exonuclease [Gemmatimonadota bacterium]|nr:MAG: 3'-5' exonuclease [Gemmatimonadota bacterium]